MAIGAIHRNMVEVLAFEQPAARPFGPQDQTREDGYYDPRQPKIDVEDIHQLE